MYFLHIFLRILLIMNLLLETSVISFMKPDIEAGQALLLDTMLFKCGMFFQTVLEWIKDLKLNSPAMKNRKGNENDKTGIGPL